jgi:hypothetical protein
VTVTRHEQQVQEAENSLEISDCAMVLFSPFIVTQLGSFVNTLFNEIKYLQRYYPKQKTAWCTVKPGLYGSEKTVTSSSPNARLDRPQSELSCQLQFRREFRLCVE